MTSSFCRLSMLSYRSRQLRPQLLVPLPCLAKPCPGQPPQERPIIPQGTTGPQLVSNHASLLELTAPTDPTSRSSPPAPFLKPATLDPKSAKEVSVSDAVLRVLPARLMARGSLGSRIDPQLPARIYQGRRAQAPFGCGKTSVAGRFRHLLCPPKRRN